MSTFPDPSASEGFSSSVLPLIDTSKGQAAYNACKHLLTGAPSFSQLQQDLQQEQEKESETLPAVLRFQQCVRSHGEPGFSVESSAGPGVDIGTPQFQAAERDCESVLPPGDQISFSTHRVQSGS